MLQIKEYNLCARLDPQTKSNASKAIFVIFSNLLFSLYTMPYASALCLLGAPDCKHENRVEDI